MIYVVQGYLVNHVVSTKSAIVITHLSVYFVILNHPVIVPIIVTDLSFKFYFLLSTYYIGNYNIYLDFIPWYFLIYLIWYLNNFLFDRLLRWWVSKSLTFFRKAYQMMVQYKHWQTIASVISIPRQRRYVWFQFNKYFGVSTEYKIYPYTL